MSTSASPRWTAGLTAATPAGATPATPTAPTTVTWPAMPAGTTSTVATLTSAPGDRVLRGDSAELATTARFDVDLRRGIARRGVTSGAAWAGGAAGRAGAASTGGAAGRAGGASAGGAGGLATGAATLGGMADGPQVDPEARAAGYAAGWAEGRQAAKTAARAEAERVAAEAAQAAVDHERWVRQAVDALAAAANRLDRRTTPTLEGFEQAIVSAAFTIAEAVIGRELAIASDPGADAIARVLQAVPDDRPVTVRLHPNDLATLAENGCEQPTCIIDGRQVRLLADRSLNPGDATAECDATTFEVRIAESVEQICAILLGEAGVAQ